MIRFFAVLFILIQLSVGHAEEVCQPVSAIPVDPAFERLALQLTNGCTLLDVKIEKEEGTRTEMHSKYWAGDKNWRKDIDVPLYDELKSEELCKCIIRNKAVNDERVPENKRDAFNNQQLNASIGKTLNLAMADLYGNITKFKNLNLPKSNPPEPSDLHSQSMSLCSPDVLKSEIESLQDACPNAKSSFPAKLKEIFGTEVIAELPGKIREASVAADKNGCLPKHQYMHLKSSNTSARSALEIFNIDAPFKQFFMNTSELATQDKLNDLLSYDILFNLGYQDEDFRKAVQQRINSLGKATATEVFDDIYNDKKILEQAVGSLDGKCREFKANIKTFLCADGTPKLSSLPLSLLVNDAVDGHNDVNPIIKQSMRDHFIGKLSCDPEPVLSPDEKKLNDYVQSTKLFRATTENPVSDASTSDYARFNDTFCGDRKTVLSGELPAMMKEFFDKKKLSNINLDTFFAKPDIYNVLGIRINSNANPAITKDPLFQPLDGLPEISSEAWAQIRPKLKDTGLSDIEIDSLYSIIEMQTNIRSRAVNELREEIAKKYPNVPSLSPADLDGLLRDTSEVDYKLRFMNPQAVELRNEISNLYAAQQTARLERFDSVQNPVNNVVETPVQVPVVPVTGDENVKQPVAAVTTPDNSTTPTGNPAKTSGLTISSTSGRSISGSGTSLSGSSLNSSSSSSASSSPRLSGRSGGGASDQSDSSISGSTSSSSRVSSSGDDLTSKRLMEDIKRVEDEIARNRAKFNNVSNAFRNAQNSTSNTSRTNNRARTGNGSQYNYPRNVPFRTPDGDYYTPNAEGDELSSASNDPAKAPESSNRSSGRSGSNGGVGGSAAPGTTATIGSVNFGSASSGAAGNSVDSGNGRRPANAGAEADIRKQLNLAPFEYHRYIPHSIFDVVGSVDKVVLLLGLEGKSFKTIEAIEEIDPKTEKINIRYIERTFDFVPAGNFTSFKEAFSSKEGRIKAFQTYFSFERTKENLKLSKKYSLATREVSKEEVPHSHVLKIQDYVLSDAEIRDTMNEVMELLK